MSRNIKEIGKELMGKSLNSYHRKTGLPHLEKNNEMQDGILGGILNQTDDGYLEKTEQSNVIHLDNSGDGVVILDSIEGNTLVNYCTDGNKELILNGNIDVEGNSITLTNGADGGLVEVECEGNTLVNLVPKCEDLTWDGDTGFNYNMWKSTPTLLCPTKHSTTYTMVVNIKQNDLALNGELNKNVNFGHLRSVGGFNNFDITIPYNHVGIYKKVITSTDTGGHSNLNHLAWCVSGKNSQGDILINQGKLIIGDIMLLEGDWTNKEISYFEGIKSVGQDDENVHKVEILSSGINTNGLSTYIDCSQYKSGDTVLVDLSGNGNDFILNKPSQFSNGALVLDGSNYATLSNSDVFKSQNTGTFIKFKVKQESTTYSHLLCRSNNAITLDGSNRFRLFPISGYDTTIPVINREVEHTLYVGDNFVMVDGIFYDKSYINTQDGGNLTYLGSYVGNENLIGEIYCLLIYNRNLSKEEVGLLNSSFTYKSNKKEITINEPLRAIPNGAKDRIVKRGNEWYVERNCIELLLDGVTNSGCTRTTTIEFNSDRTRLKYPFTIGSVKNTSKILCDKLVQVADITGLPNDADGISTGSSSWKILLNLPVSLVGDTDSSVNAYLQQNNLRIVAELDTPIYEPIEEELILNTYSGITYIENSSIIPCNMKIKNNDHYNCILKPSTLYTVAFDTDKSEDVSVNLGGTTGNTTNNVLTLVTPETLVDNSLRLYGSGSKCSNIRLLEGDKTNCIPNYFEGLQSSFEENKEDDKYKIEILSRTSKNLYDLKTVNHDWGGGTMNVTISSNDLNYHSCEPFDISHLRGKTIYVGMFREGILRNGGIDFVVIFDENGNRLGYRFNITSQGYLVPNNAKYMRLMQNCGGNSKSWIDKDKYVVKLEPFVWGEKLVKHKSNKIKLLINEPLRLIGDTKDKFIFKDGKLMIERNCGEVVLNNLNCNATNTNTESVNVYYFDNVVKNKKFISYSSYGQQTVIADNKKTGLDFITWDKLESEHSLANNNTGFWIFVPKNIEGVEWLANNPTKVVYLLNEPIYEEVLNEYGEPILLEGYENGTLYVDSTIAPTTTVRYTPKMESFNTLKEVKNGNNLLTDDINDNIIPYMMDVDLMIMEKEMNLLSSFNKNIRTMEVLDMTSMQKRTQQMLERLIKGKTLSEQECQTRVTTYLNANKITDEQAEELMLLISEVYA